MENGDGGSENNEAEEEMHFYSTSAFTKNG